MVVVTLRVQLTVYMTHAVQPFGCNMASVLPRHRSAEASYKSHIAGWAPVAKQMAATLAITTLLLLTVTTLFVAPAAARALQTSCR
jgi:hypothetical protein